MKTAIVILNWNTRRYLEQFLPFLIDSTKEADAEIIVADNASSDGSMEMMSRKFPEIRQIRLDRNYGFTGGYNIALSQIDADYFVLMNSDIEVGKHWLEPLVEAMDGDSTIGACGPKLLSWHKRDRFEYAGAAGGCLDRYGYPFCRGRIMKRIEKDEGQYDKRASVFWASGACLMVRSELFRRLGGLDDRFFAHMEEIDLCWRIQLEGYKIEIIPEAVAYHLGGGTLPNDSPWKLKLNFRNNLLMLENNLAKTYALSYSQMWSSADGIAAMTADTVEKDRYVARKACKKAERTICFRMILDALSAATYALTFRNGYFKAVIDAHKEFREKRRKVTVGDIASFLETRRQKFCKNHRQAIAIGLYPHWIVPMSLIKGKKIFEYVRITGQFNS